MPAAADGVDVLDRAPSSPGVDPVPGLVDPPLVPLVRIGERDDAAQAGARLLQQAQSDRHDARDRGLVLAKRDAHQLARLGLAEPEALPEVAGGPTAEEHA